MVASFPAPVATVKSPETALPTLSRVREPAPVLVRLPVPEIAP